MNTQTQSKINITKTKRYKRFSMKKSKPKLRLIRKNDNTKTRKTVVKVENYQQTDKVSFSRPDYDYEKILSQISPVNNALTGIRIA